MYNSTQAPANGVSQQQFNNPAQLNNPAQPAWNTFATAEPSVTAHVFRKETEGVKTLDDGSKVGKWLIDEETGKFKSTKVANLASAQEYDEIVVSGFRDVLNYSPKLALDKIDYINRKLPDGLIMRCDRKATVNHRLSQVAGRQVRAFVSPDKGALCGVIRKITTPEGESVNTGETF